MYCRLLMICDNIWLIFFSPKENWNLSKIKYIAENNSLHLSRKIVKKLSAILLFSLQIKIDFSSKSMKKLIYLVLLTVACYLIVEKDGLQKEAELDSSPCCEGQLGRNLGWMHNELLSKVKDQGGDLQQRGHQWYEV